MAADVDPNQQARALLHDDSGDHNDDPGFKTMQAEAWATIALAESLDRLSKALKDGLLRLAIATDH